MKRHVIVGNGASALSAIKAIRELVPLDEIVSVSREFCPAYSPVLTVYYLCGFLSYRGMFLCDERFYHSQGVTTRWGLGAVKVVPEKRQLFLADGSALPYDDLLVATGSTPVVPRIIGANLPCVFTLWTARDAQRLRPRLQKANRVAVIGAGMIGLQVVNALLVMGKQVVLVEIGDRVAPAVLDEAGANLLQHRLAAVGVEVHLGQGVTEIAGRRGPYRLYLTSGREVYADVVVLATGVQANMDWLQGSGVAMAQGVLVDEFCRTSTDGIYAAGDVADSYDVQTGRPRVQAIWPNAIEQGRIAGLNMAGARHSRLRTSRYNVFTVAGMPCVSLGDIDGDSNKVAFNGGGYSKIIFREGALVGAVLIGDIGEAGVLLNLIENRAAKSQLDRAGGDPMLVKFPCPRAEINSWQSIGHAGGVL